VAPLYSANTNTYKFLKCRYTESAMSTDKMKTLSDQMLV